MKNTNKFLVMILLAATISACKKGPGSGGTSSINGSVQVIKYNAFYTDTLAMYPGYDEDVYIIYGDDISYGDHLKSSADGRFEFKYLREGNYKVYVYSDDTIHADTVPSKIAVLKNIEITQKDQEIDAGEFEVNKH
ncbi:MAG: hypothetical protein ABIT08_17925 [Bacteroidia bacterium]